MDINESIKKYIYLVDRAVNKYKEKDADSREDLRQEGLIGLWKALISYDEEKNDNFEAYATIIINNQIKSEIKKKNSRKNRILSDSVELNNELVGDKTIIIDEEALKKVDIEFVKVCVKTKSVTEKMALTGLSRVMIKRKMREEKQKLWESLID